MKFTHFSSLLQVAHMKGIIFWEGENFNPKLNSECFFVFNGMNLTLWTYDSMFKYLKVYQAQEK